MGGAVLKGAKSYYVVSGFRWCLFVGVLFGAALLAIGICQGRSGGGRDATSLFFCGFGVVCVLL